MAASTVSQDGRLNGGKGWREALTDCLISDAFAMEVKNYGQPWLPLLSDGAVNVDALKRPFLSYHDAICNAIHQDALSAVVVNASTLPKQPPVGFIAIGTKNAPIEIPPNTSAVLYLLAAAKGEKPSELATHIMEWRKRLGGILLFSPYVVTHDPRIKPIAGNIAAARQALFEGSMAPAPFLQIGARPADDYPALHVGDETYFESAWVFGIPPADAVEEVQLYTTLISVQYQMSWGYPAMADQQVAAALQAENEHQRADRADESAKRSQKDALELREAATRITGGLGTLKTVVSAGYDLVRLADPLKPGAEALEQASEVLSRKCFPADRVTKTVLDWNAFKGNHPHHLTTHLSLEPHDKHAELEAIQDLLKSVEWECGSWNPKDESISLVTSSREYIGECLTDSSRYDFGLARAKALCEKTVLLEMGGAVAEALVLDPHARGPYFVDAVVRAHQLYSRQIRGVTEVTFKESKLLITTDDGLDLDELLEAMRQHLARTKTARDGDWSLVFASLLRGLYNNADANQLLTSVRDNVTWNSDERTLAIPVRHRKLVKRNS